MKSQNKKLDPFGDWINATGLLEVSRLLKVHPDTVKTWRAGTFCPRVDQMRRIRKLTNGQITYETMIDRRLTKRVRVSKLKRAGGR